MCVGINQFNNINKNVKKGNGPLGISIDNWAIYTYKFYSSYYIYMYLSTNVSIDMSTLVGPYTEFFNNMLSFTIAGGLTEMETMPYLARQFSL